MALKKVITYGTYDLLHYGHIALLERAKALGDYLIVGVTSDVFDRERGKLNVKQSLAERIEAVRATGIADEIIVEEYEGQKISDIQKYDVDIFTVGSDWEGKFDYLKDYCEVTYLPRTQGVSSTELRASESPEIHLGIVGVSNPATRFVDEALYVSGISVTCAYDEDEILLEKFCTQKHIKKCGSKAELLKQVDAVFIVDSIDKHYNLIVEAFEAGCHVMCNPPIFMSETEAKKVFQYAIQKKLVVFEGLKTLFFPAFEHLLLLVNSGVIGAVKDIDVSCSQIPLNFDEICQDVYQGSMYDWASTVMLPIVKILGEDYKKCLLYNYKHKGFSWWTRGTITYPNAVASFKVGKGMKVEGDLIITGTKGYIYVPAPWWKTEYFEIRYEDLRDTKKYFYKFEGEGFRYMILEFVRMINNEVTENYKYTRNEMLQTTKIIEQFANDKVELI